MARRQRKRPHKNLATYEYQPLDPSRMEIRLLLVHAASKYRKSRLRCTMKHVSLLDDPLPEYETISYVWGDPTVRRNIIVNGRQLNIVATAERALRRIRFLREDTLLWIDSACINQDDVVERGSQVGMMARIYKSTTCNLIWLGEDDGSTALAIRSVHRVVEDLRRRTQGFTDIMMICRYTNRQYTDKLLSDYETGPLCRLFKLSWFSRVWVVQEAALASRNACFCGEIEIALLDVLRAAIWLHCHTSSLPHQLYLALKGAASMWDPFEPRLQHSKRRPVFLDFLVLSGYHEASDPRDHVYGILGIFEDRCRPDLGSLRVRPDYSKSVSAVLQDATMAMIEDSGDLQYLRHLLHRPKATNERMDATPSWVLRCDRFFNLEEDPAPFNCHFADGADWNSLFRPPPRSSDGVIVLHGTIVDSVANTTSFGSAVTLSRTIEQLCSWHRTIISEEDDQVLRRDDSNAAVAMTLIAATDHRRERASLDFAQEGFDAFTRYLTSFNVYPPRPSKGDVALQDPAVMLAACYFQAFSYTICGRRYFVTTTGLIGVGSRMVQPGDIVTILYGSDLPIILRPCPASDEYEMVGPAYVYGIMDGEAVEPKKAGVKNVMFTIR